MLMLKFNPRLFDLLSELVTYPEPGVEARWTEAKVWMAEALPAAADDMAEFVSRMSWLSQGEREELYTRTFDHSPSCALEIGWHVHGENYARGSFMVMMRESMARFGVEEGRELPDHLSHVLRCLPRMQTERAELVYTTYIPKSLDAILAGIDNEAHPYNFLFRALRTFLEAAFDEGGR